MNKIKRGQALDEVTQLVPDIRNNEHLFLVAIREHEHYKVRDYNRAIRTLRLDDSWLSSWENAHEDFSRISPNPSLSAGFVRTNLDRLYRFRHSMFRWMMSNESPHLRSTPTGSEASLSHPDSLQISVNHS